MAGRAETGIERERRLSYEAARAAVAFGEANPDSDELDLASYSQGYRDAAGQADLDVRALQVAKQLAERRVDESRAEVRPLREALEAVGAQLWRHVSERPRSDRARAINAAVAEVVEVLGDRFALAPEPAEAQ